jgi:integrase/recombinase XerD
MNNNLPIQSSYRSLVRASDATALPKYYKPDEISFILDACRQREAKKDALLIDFLWKTGVRISELNTIKYKDVDSYLKTLKVITLKRSRAKTKGRKASVLAERSIPLPDDLLNLVNVQRIEDGAQAEDRIFPQTRTWLFRRIKAACAQVGLDDGRAHPHTFRHSYAVHLLKNNVPITVVQKLLGHSSIENTAIYLAVVQSDIREFVERVEW